MIFRVLATWFGRRRPPPPDVTAAAAAVAPAKPPVPATVQDVLRAHVESSGGPPELEPGSWSDLTDDLVQRIEQASTPLTAFPALACRLIDVLEQPDPDLNELVRLIHQDVAVTSQVLAAANSALYSPPSPVTTIRQAVQMLGTRQVGEIAIAVAARSVFDVGSRVEREVFPALWLDIYRDAMTDAFTSGWLGFTLRVGKPDQAFVAGMLGELGRLVALRTLSAAIVAGELERPDPLIAVAALDDVAPLAGARAVAALGLPQDLQDACRVHVAEPRPEACISRMVTAIGAISRRSPRMWAAAAAAHTAAERLGCTPNQVRAAIWQRADDAAKAQHLAG